MADLLHMSCGKNDKDLVLRSPSPCSLARETLKVACNHDRAATETVAIPLSASPRRWTVPKPRLPEAPDQNGTHAATASFDNRSGPRVLGAAPRDLLARP